MNYRQRSKEKGLFTKIVYVLGFLVLLSFVFTFVLSVFEAPKNFLAQVATPVWESENRIVSSIKNSTSFFSSKASLIEENEELEEKLASLSSLELAFRLLEQENRQLKQELGRSLEDADTVLANILVRPNKSPYDTLIIDTGANHNIRVGNKVISQEVVLLGEVVDVFPNSAKVLLYSASGVTTDVTIGEENISAEAVGRGGSNFEIEIPREVGVASSSIIMAPGSRSFTLGIVDEVQSTPQDPLKKILFKTPVNIQQLRWVTVLREE